jgi:tetratricopeptide (TPR) repeat protein
MTRLWALLLCLSTVLAGASAAAQENSADQKTLARERFGEASAAHARGDYLEAAKLFEEAHRLAPAAGAKFNAGIAWDQAGDLPRAADAYETALEMGGLDQQDAKQAESRLSALKQVLGSLRIEEPTGAVVSVAHLDRAPVPARAHVRPGDYQLRAEIGAHTTTLKVVIGAGEVKTVRFDKPGSGGKIEPTPRVTKRKRGDPLAATPGPEDRPPSRSSAQKTWGFIALGAGVVLGGTAVFLGTRTLSARDDYVHDGEKDQDKYDKAVALRTWTNVTAGGAVVAGGLGTVLLLTAPTVEF